MRKNQKGFASLLPLVILITIIVAGTVGYLVYHARHKASPDSVVLMILTSSGGMCGGPCNHPVNKLYADGGFEGYRGLSESELSELKNIIQSTDFSKYAPNPHPRCESFVDGSDQVLLFPQKYGDKTFTTCMLDIPANDPAFGYIDKLIENHYIKPTE